jgi:hypothetical protein
VSRVPSKPRAKKASAVTNIADAPKRMPRKRAPARAVAVETGVADAAPVQPRKGMGEFLIPAPPLAAHKSTAATVKRAREELWASLDAVDPVHAGTIEANRRASRDTTIYGLIVAAILIVVCVYVFWWSWK